MRFNIFIALFLLVTFNSEFLLASQGSSDAHLIPEFISSLPAWEGFDDPPEPIVGSPPVYLDVDSKGNVYREKAVQNNSGIYEFSHELISQRMLNKIRSQQEVILQNMEDIALPGEESSTENSSSCPLPSSFRILSDGEGVAWGSTKVADTNRPPGVTTQWIVFDFYTSTLYSLKLRI